MSYISSVGASSSLYASTTAPSSSTSLQPFANLDLTEAQRTQIRAIFKNAQSQGLSQSQVQQQINAVLTPAQQTQLQADLQNAQQAGPPPGGPPPGGNPFTDPNGPFANLNLSSSQKNQIESILQNARSQKLSPQQVNAQVSAILTTSQQTLFQQDVQTAQAQFSGHQHQSSAGGGTTLSATQNLGSFETTS